MVTCTFMPIHGGGKEHRLITTTNSRFRYYSFMFGRPTFVVKLTNSDQYS